MSGECKARMRRAGAGARLDVLFDMQDAAQVAAPQQRSLLRSEAPRQACHAAMMAEKDVCSALRMRRSLHGHGTGEHRMRRSAPGTRAA